MPASSSQNLNSTDSPCPGNTGGGITVHVMAGGKLENGVLNPYKALWLETIAGDESLSPDACRVAVIISEAVGIGRIAFTNWQRLNIALGRSRTDYQVFASIQELQAAGYLGRFQGNRYNHSRGWSLSLPEREL